MPLNHSLGFPYMILEGGLLTPMTPLDPPLIMHSLNGIIYEESINTEFVNFVKGLVIFVGSNFN